MAVKLMPVAPVGSHAVAPAEPGQVDERTRQPRKRRRAAVYDADGNEVLITLKCLKCGRMHPLSNFGLRKMADGAIRNQPWCRDCRGASSPKKKPDAPPSEPAAPAEPVEVVVEPAASSGPMQVVPLTVEQVLRALAPERVIEPHAPVPQPELAPAEPEPGEPAPE